MQIIVCLWNLEGGINPNHEWNLNYWLKTPIPDMDRARISSYMCCHSHPICKSCSYQWIQLTRSHWVPWLYSQDCPTHGLLMDLMDLHAAHIDYSTGFGPNYSWMRLCFTSRLLKYAASSLSCYKEDATERKQKHVKTVIRQVRSPSRKWPSKSHAH